MKRCKVEFYLLDYGFAAPDGQPVGLTTGAWTTLRVAHNSTAPATAKGISLAGMKEKKG